MKVTLFTSNQARHLFLIKSLSAIADVVYVIQECTTFFPGETHDFYPSSEIMTHYFDCMLRAEKKVFGEVSFLPENVQSLGLKMGDINRVDPKILHPALSSDLYLVFGASYFKSPLLDLLISKDAINLHMGISPYYRGSGSNFWALYDGYPQLVGASIHKLTKDPDAGPVFFHVIPPRITTDPFVFGMQAVHTAHQVLIENIRNERLFALSPIEQDCALEIRYCQPEDFTHEIAARYLENLPSLGEFCFNKRELEPKLCRARSL